MNKHLTKSIHQNGAKKILSCDGGGILGLMSVEILAKIEADLRIETNQKNLVLADYFDFVCGTSTGAIIATCIACGMSMDQIRNLYLNNGEEMFKYSYFGLPLRYLTHKYTDKKLAKILKKEINDVLGYGEGDDLATLCNENIKSLLMMVMYNSTTDSPWFVSNNPNAKYNKCEERELEGKYDCNCKLPLWQLVRASTAAPTYFPAEKVTLAEGTDHEYTFVFQDGGVTSYNNAAFLAFQMATAKPYGLNWKTGVDDLLIVSVGTGTAAKTNRKVSWLWQHAEGAPSALMNGASAGWDMACRVLGECNFGGTIDREFGNMVNEQEDSNWTGNKLFSYIRYNPDTTQEGLEKELGIKDMKAENVQELDAVEYMSDIQQVGEEYAKQFVNLEHLGSFV